jgi:hypothetical protein
MGAIKDIVDLAIQLEGRVKDRRDIDTLRQIHSLAFSLQAEHAEVIERDIRVMQENAKLVQDKAELERKLTEAQSEDIRFHGGLEFRRSKKTGDKWMPYCPTCHIPALADPLLVTQVTCSKCQWDSYIPVHSVQTFISKL